MKDYHDHIADYIADKLSTEDKSSFERAMQADSDLKQAVEDYDIIEMIGDGVFEEEIAGVVADELRSKENDASNNQSKTVQLIKWLGAACVLGIIGYMGYQQAIPKSKIQYADLYDSPPWDSKRGNATPLEGAIELYLNENIQAGIDSLKHINTPEANYWIAEIFAENEVGDSVLVYAPEIFTDKINRDRITYLKILAHFSNGNKSAYLALINNLPEDTDKWYLEKYALIR